MTIGGDLTRRTHDFIELGNKLVWSRGGCPPVDSSSSVHADTHTLARARRCGLRRATIMEEAKARAERLRAMRDAASSSSTDPSSTGARTMTLPAPFIDRGNGDGGSWGGFYTGAGDGTCAPSGGVGRPPPPLQPPPRPRTHEFSGGRGQCGSGGPRGRKAPRTERHSALDPAAYYKVRDVNAFKRTFEPTSLDSRGVVVSFRVTKFY